MSLIPCTELWEQSHKDLTQDGTPGSHEGKQEHRRSIAHIKRDDDIDLDFEYVIVTV